jgi:hypothetical protein
MNIQQLTQIVFTGNTFEFNRTINTLRLENTQDKIVLHCLFALLININTPLSHYFIGRFLEQNVIDISYENYLPLRLAILHEPVYTIFANHFVNQSKGEELLNLSFRLILASNDQAVLQRFLRYSILDCPTILHRVLT